jgi:regulatory protein SWI5
MPTNTPGLQNTSQHQFLREAQQQRIKARPGTHQGQHTSSFPPPLAPTDRDTYLISPHGTPQSQRFDASCFDSSPVPFDAYGQFNMMMMQKAQQTSFTGDMSAEGKNFDIFNSNSNTNSSALSTPTFMNFQESPSTQGWTSEGDTTSTRRSSRRISNGIMDRVSKFESLGLEELDRPATPPDQNASGYFPPTPMETPQHRAAQQQMRTSRFSDDYDESMEETLKPTRKSNVRAQNIFQDLRCQAEQRSISPQSNVPMQMQAASFVNLQAFDDEFIKVENGYQSQPGDLDSFHCPSDQSQQSTPATTYMSQFMHGFGNKPELQSLEKLETSASSSPTRRGTPHRRTESLASIASAASIASIKIEETKTETGVSGDDIAQYISGPDSADGKWMCLFEDCGKKFGRKENIKSHVQTHLNDRQYQCPTCQKCFVRQHDLKRHAKIHTGIKPYPCECGNSFARHDALTRHRQRGMCIGAFDGIVRKVVKRGRPRKNRPDMESRMDKSARTRQKNLSISSMSSQSGYSDSDSPTSPDNDYNMLDDMIDMEMTAQPQSMTSASTAPMPVMAPRITTEMMAASPEESLHSYVSPEAIMERTPSRPASPAKSAASQYNTPPELSQSSSPAPAHYFDAEPNSSGLGDLSDLSTGSVGVITTTSMDGTLPLGMSDHDDDMLLQFASSNGMTHLERDSGMLMMSKFDEEFDNAVGMFGNSNDMFFGTA